MRKAATLVLLAGLGAAVQAAPGPALEVRVTDALSTGSLSDPAGLPVQETAVRLRYRGPGWSAQAELPWLRVVSGPESALPPAARADEGAGDLRLKVAVPLRAASRAATGLDLVLRMNAGRGAEVGGVVPDEAGQSIRLVMERPLGGWTAFGHVGLQRAGTLPGAAAGRRAWVGEIGASRLLAPRIESGAFVSLRQRVAVAAALPEATLYAALEDGDWRCEAFVSRAFARDAGDLSAGIALRGRF